VVTGITVVLKLRPNISLGSLIVSAFSLGGNTIDHWGSKLHRNERSTSKLIATLISNDEICFIEFQSQVILSPTDSNKVHNALRKNSFHFIDACGDSIYLAR